MGFRTNCRQAFRFIGHARVPSADNAVVKCKLEKCRRSHHNYSGATVNRADSSGNPIAMRRHRFRNNHAGSVAGTQRRCPFGGGQADARGRRSLSSTAGGGMGRHPLMEAIQQYHSQRALPAASSECSPGRLLSSTIQTRWRGSAA